LGVGVALMLVIVCCKSCARAVPGNYILLFLFTAAWSYMVAGICGYYDPTSVFVVACMTLSMTVGLTFLGCFMKDDDVNCCIGFATALVFVLIPMIIFSWFYMDRFLFIMISGLVVLLTSIYIIIDANMIAKRLSVDDYIFGALTLYIDII
jgi:protein lifeguard